MDTTEFDLGQSFLSISSHYSMSEPSSPLHLSDLSLSSTHSLSSQPQYPITAEVHHVQTNFKDGMFGVPVFQETPINHRQPILVPNMNHVKQSPITNKRVAFSQERFSIPLSSDSGSQIGSNISTHDFLTADEQYSGMLKDGRQLVVSGNQGNQYSETMQQHTSLRNGQRGSPLHHRSESSPSRSNHALHSSADTHRTYGQSPRHSPKPLKQRNHPASSYQGGAGGRSQSAAKDVSQPGRTSNSSPQRNTYQSPRRQGYHVATETYPGSTRESPLRFHTSNERPPLQFDSLSLSPLRKSHSETRLVQSPPTKDTAKYLYGSLGDVNSSSHLSRSCGPLIGSQYDYLSKPVQSNISHSLQLKDFAKPYKPMNPHINIAAVKSSVLDDVVGMETSKSKVGKEHPVDDIRMDSKLTELSLISSFSLDPSRVSPIMWATQSLAEPNPRNPTAYYDMLMKSRIFHQWYQRARFRKTLQQDEQNKVLRADKYRAVCVVRQTFNRWYTVREEKILKADLLRRRHLTRKGMRAFKFASIQEKQMSGDCDLKLKGHLLAKFWIRWQTQLKMKKSKSLKQAFNQLQLNRLEKSREKLLQRMAYRHFLSKTYFKWKTKYKIEQNNALSGLHYKIALLTRMWHEWRIYTSQRVVKTRLCEVARVHHEEHIQVRLFIYWKKQTKKSILARNYTMKRVAVKAFYQWRQWTDYAKIIRLRYQSMCKEYYHKTVIRSTFIKWKQRLHYQQAEKFHKEQQVRRAFRLWALRNKRKTIHKHLCKALSKRARARRFFVMWVKKATWQQETRTKFISSLQRFVLRCAFHDWREFTNNRKDLRMRYDELTAKRHRIIQENFWKNWKFAMRVVEFRQQARINWTKRCVRKGAEAWKTLIKKKHLNETLIESQPVWELFIIKRFLNKWKEEKSKLDQEKEHAGRVYRILSQNILARVLQAWRVVNQESQIIAPVVARRHRKDMAWVFDAWFRLIKRKRDFQSHQQHKENNKLKESFEHWRYRSWGNLKEREAKEELARLKMERFYNKWKERLQQNVNKRLKKKQEKEERIRQMFLTWHNKASFQAREREIEQGDEARLHLLLLHHFRLWRRNAASQHLVISEAIQAVEERSTNYLVTNAFERWKRQYIAENLAREHQENKTEELLHNTIIHWRNIAKMQMQIHVENFKEILHEPAPSQVSTPGYFSGSGYHVSPVGIQTPVSLYQTSLSPEMDREDEVFVDVPSSSPIYSKFEDFMRANTPPHSFTLPLQNSIGSDFLSRNLTPDSDAIPSSGIHSAEGEMDSFEDEQLEQQSNNGSVLSFYSMIAPSEIMVPDRKTVVIETILHWRSLSLSISFRKWLKYTRHRRLLRQLLFHYKERKKITLMDGSLTFWRRKLYCIVTSREHRIEKLNRTHFSAWKYFIELQKLKAQRKIEATEQREMTLVRSNFDYWKRKSKAKKKLASIIGQWVKNVTVTETQREKSQALTKKHELRCVRESFKYWIQTYKNQETAKEHCYYKVLASTLSGWRKTITLQIDRKNKVKEFQEKREQREAFSEWKRMFAAMKIAKAFDEECQQRRVTEIVYVWHQWAADRVQQRLLSQEYCHSLSIKLLQGCFSIWANEAQQQQYVKAHHHETLMRKVFIAWQDTCHQQGEHRQLLHQFRETQKQKMMSGIFTDWHRKQIHTRALRIWKHQSEEKTIQHTFNRWRDLSLDQRAEKHYSNKVQKKFYRDWFSAYFKRKKLQRIVRKWKRTTVVSIEKSETAEESYHQHEVQTLKQTFSYWILATQYAETAREYYRNRLLKSALKGWKHTVQRRVCHVKTLEDFQDLRKTLLITRAFNWWKDNFEVNLKNEMILSEYLDSKNNDLLQNAMIMWRKDTLNGRSQKFVYNKLILKTFTQWKHQLYVKQTLQDIVQRNFTKKIRRAAMHWKHWTQKAKVKQQTAGDVRAKRDQKTLHSFFMKWMQATEKEERAKQFYNQKINKRVFRGWQGHIKKKKQELVDIKEFQNQHNLKQKFSVWKQALEEKRVGKQKEATLGDSAEHYYGKMICKRLFKTWKLQFMLKKRIKEKNELNVKKCWSLWRKKTTIVFLSSDMGNKKVYEKFWLTWRKVFIRNRVSSAMKAQDDKKMMSQVFMGWFEYTSIRRSIPREFRLNKTEKYFRKWMERYNSS